MKTREIKLNSISKVGISNFSVDPEVLGLSTKFCYDNYDVTISIPKESDDNRTHVSARFTKSDIPSRYEILSLDVLVVVKGRVTVPVKMLDVSCNAYDIVENGLKSNLERKIVKYQKVSNEAIDAWLRCLRWKCNDWRVGRYSASTGEYVDVSNVSLVDNESGKELWGGDLHYTMPGCRTITKECIVGAGDALRNKQLSPVYYDLLFDSEAHLAHGEIKRSLVEAAMAAEVLVRTFVEGYIPKNLNVKIRDYVERASVRTVFESFFLEQLSREQRKVFNGEEQTFKKKILSLFSDRNIIMHSGVISDLDRDACLEHISNVKKLFSVVGV